MLFNWLNLLGLERLSIKLRYLNAPLESVFVIYRVFGGGADHKVQLRKIMKTVRKLYKRAFVRTIPQCCICVHILMYYYK